MPCVWKAENIKFTSITKKLRFIHATNSSQGNQPCSEWELVKSSIFEGFWRRRFGFFSNGIYQPAVSLNEIKDFQSSLTFREVNCPIEALQKPWERRNSALESGFFPKMECFNFYSKKVKLERPVFCFILNDFLRSSDYSLRIWSSLEILPSNIYWAKQFNLNEAPTFVK